MGISLGRLCATTRGQALRTSGRYVDIGCLHDGLADA
jgi:hypothetical protein